MHLPALLVDLAIILGLAGVVTLVFRRLNQPVVLGYILAGILTGPHVPWFPTVTDIPNIQVLAELGIVFLLFSLGLEFSFAKLLKTGFAAISIAVIEVIGMAAIGYAIGRALSWSTLDSAFLGGILSISSTTIIIKAIEELKLKSHHFTRTVFGVLIMEDLIAILILIALSTIAGSREIQGMPLLLALGRLSFSVPLLVLVGLYLVPRILRICRRWLNDEGLLIFSLGFCLGMVLLTNTLGYSAALGAFISGAILAESAEGTRIEKLVHPLRNLFGSIFFVSVGMLFDPFVLSEHAGVVALLTVVTIFGKAFATGFGALAAGQGTRASVQIAFSMAQIGEFSFIIASLGANLKVTSDFLYPIAVTVALVTSFTTPYMIRSSEAFATWLDQRIPSGPESWLKRYEIALSSMRSSGSPGGVRSTIAGYAQAVRRTLRAEPVAFQRLAPWNAHLSRVNVEPGARLAGQTLRELQVRKDTGANVLVVLRAQGTIVAPEPDLRILPTDELIVLGTDEQIQALHRLSASNHLAQANYDPAEFTLLTLKIEADSPLNNQTIAEAEIREKFQGIVVGIESAGVRTVNPDSEVRLKTADAIWVVCPRARQQAIAAWAHGGTAA